MSNLVPRLPILDYLRFLAAMAVVSFHYFFNGIENGKVSSINHVSSVIAWAKYGYLGVDLFFLISGYVIFISASRRDAKQFLVGRTVRLYPAYLAAMITTAFFAYFIANEKMRVEPLQVLGNLLMYRPIHRQTFVDGVYWTLIIEINFYLMIFFFLAMGFSKKLEKFMLWWPIIMTFATIMGKGDLPLLGGYYSFFAGGVLLSMLRTKFELRTFLSVILSFGLSVEYVLRNISDHQEISKFLVMCILAAFYLVFFMVNQSDKWNFKFPFSKQLGALTYPIYLLHAHIGYMLLSRYASNENRWAAYFGVFCIVLIMAASINFFVERKMKAFWEEIFESIFSSLEKITSFFYNFIGKVIYRG
ncbi:acyltransferase family protein [Variovorax sp. RHLX14]|uniref:acyltransferase family protein n=1 Tax=Variovorax sp. RHLX14 TaxID=1259731 RepID=UPI003F46B4F6